MFNLSPLGFIEISGPDAAKFLQGQLTCDVLAVTPEQASFGAHCDPKGRVQFSFLLFKYQDNFYLHLPREMIPVAMNCLQKYLIFSKTKLIDVSDQWHVSGVINPDNNNSEVVLKIPGKDSRFVMLGKNIGLVQEIQDYQAWQLLDIKSGVASINLVTTGLFTPHDLNYPQLNAVSFKKGCYTGQEIVARMHYLGKPKQSLYRFSVTTDEVIGPGMKLFDENHQEIGIIVNSALEGSNNHQFLAVVRDTTLNQPIFLDKIANQVKKLDLNY